MTEEQILRSVQEGPPPALTAAQRLGRHLGMLRGIPPRWIRLALLVALTAAAIAFSKWVILFLLGALALWPITLLLGLAGLALVSAWRGGGEWMRQWLGSRLRGLLVPSLAVLSALIIGGLVLMFTDQQVYEVMGEGHVGQGIKLALSNLGRAYGALYEGALGNPVKIRQALGESFGVEQVNLILPLILLFSIVVVLIRLVSLAWASRRARSSGGDHVGFAARIRPLLGPVAVIILALGIGALLVLLADETVAPLLKSQQIGQEVQSPQVSQAFRQAMGQLSAAFRSLFAGELSSPVAAVEEGVDVLRPVLRAVRAPSESLVQSVPYILAGLAVALGFRAGLFNIGAEGQIGVGWLVAVLVGYEVVGLRPVLHLPLAIAAGAAAAGVWASIAGILKARTGAHEVITTIMLNYVVYRLSDWLLCGPMQDKVGTCRTKEIAESAFLPSFWSHPVTIHWGFVLALVAALLVGWFLFRTKWGFELRTVGANPQAARYGGMNVAKNYVLAMFLSGSLAGLAGVVQGLGITHNIAMGFQAGYGFDSIALALLGKSHPAGVVGASLLFGLLRAGAGRMQSVAGIPTEIVQIVQSLVIVFIAAPAIIQAIYRLREARREEAEVTVFSRGWGA